MAEPAALPVPKAEAEPVTETVAEPEPIAMAIAEPVAEAEPIAETVPEAEPVAGPRPGANAAPRVLRKVQDLGSRVFRFANGDQGSDSRYCA